MNLRESISRISQIEISCSTTSDTDYRIKFSIVAMDRATNNTVFSRESILCTTSTQTLKIADTVCDRVYLVFAQFSFPNGSTTECRLSNIATINSGVCPTSDAPTEGRSYRLYSRMQSYDKIIYTKILGPTSNTLAIVLSIVIVGVVALIVTVIIIVALVLTKHGAGTYSPQQAELHHGVNLQKEDETKVAEKEKKT